MSCFILFLFPMTQFSKYTLSSRYKQSFKNNRIKNEVILIPNYIKKDKVMN